MSLWLESEAGEFTQWLGEPINDEVWPQDIELLWSPEKLAEYGLYKPVTPEVPAGKVITTTTVERVDGVVMFVYGLIDTPMPALTMRQLRLGLKNIGGKPVTFIQDIINLMSNESEKGDAQIWYEETSIVQWDHPMTQQLITASGISAEDAKAMWLAAKQIPA